MTCTRCGKWISETDITCPHCGAAVSQWNGGLPAEMPGGHDGEEPPYYAFITGKAELPERPPLGFRHYKEAFEFFQSRGGPVYWNWAAFLSTYNLLYRKNWVMLGILFVAVMVSAGVETALRSKLLGGLLLLLSSVGTGLLADWFYYRRYLSKLGEALRRFPRDGAGRREYLAAAGGTSLLPVLAGLIIWLVVTAYAAQNGL